MILVVNMNNCTTLWIYLVAMQKCLVVYFAMVKTDKIPIAEHLPKEICSINAIKILNV